MTWSTGDRPGDVLRVLAQLDVDPHATNWLEPVSGVLGLERAQTDAPVAPPRLEPAASVGAPPGDRQAVVVVTRRSRRLRWLLIACIASVAFGGLALIGGATVRDTMIAIAFYVGLGALLVTLIGRLRRWFRTLRRRRSAPPPVAFDAPPTAPAAMPLLLRREERRSIAQALASTIRPGHDIDVEEAVERAATGRSVPTPLPLMPEVTVATATHVLVDRSDTMSAMRADVDDLIEATVRVVGAERVDVQFFDTDPRLGVGPGPRYDWKPFDVADVEPGARVVILSDAGAAAADRPTRMAGQRRWDEFVDELVDADAEALLVTVYPRRRYHGWPARDVPAVHWSDETTVRDVLTAVRTFR